MSQLAIISEPTVRKIVTRQLAFDAVRKAFESVAIDRSQVFDVVIGTGLNNGEAFAIKSGLDGENELVGFKCGTYWAGNFEKNLPAHGSTILLLDPETGFPQALVSASYLNGYRTAAANAVAVSSLARSDAAVMGVIGAGHQAEQEIRAVAEVRSLSLSLEGRGNRDPVNECGRCRAWFRYCRYRYPIEITTRAGRMDRRRNSYFGDGR
jgi:ornithine cyclodeaminase